MKTYKYKTFTQAFHKVILELSSNERGCSSLINDFNDNRGSSSNNLDTSTNVDHFDLCIRVEPFESAFPSEAAFAKSTKW